MRSTSASPSAASTLARSCAGWP